MKGHFFSVKTTIKHVKQPYKKMRKAKYFFFSFFFIGVSHFLHCADTSGVNPDPYINSRRHASCYNPAYSNSGGVYGINYEFKLDVHGLIWWRHSPASEFQHLSHPGGNTPAMDMIAADACRIFAKESGNNILWLYVISDDPRIKSKWDGVVPDPSIL